MTQGLRRTTVRRRLGVAALMADTRHRELAVTDRATVSGRQEHLTDEGLVAAIARLDPDALAEAYSKHGSRVLAIARGLCGEARAEELTEQIFLQLWNNPERFDPSRGSLRGHLLMQAHGRAIDVLRSERDHGAPGSTGDALHDAEQTATAVLALTLLERAEVNEQVAALAADERHPIVLAYFGGHTYRDIARLLGVPEEAVKSRIRSGLERLRAEGATEGFLT